MQQTATTTSSGPVSLSDFVKKHEQADLGTPWQLENDRTLEINISNQTVYTKRGAMVAYYGDLKFEATSGANDLGKMLKKFLTKETTQLMKVSGQGKLYVADNAKSICLVKLNNESICLNGNDILAYESSLEWDVEISSDLGGMATMGLFSLKLSGTGIVAFTSHGKPLVLTVTPDKPLYTDPNATVCWSKSLTRSIKKDINFKTLIGRSSGETIQVCFNGSGFVVVQPYEEITPLAE